MKNVNTCASSLAEMSCRFRGLPKNAPRGLLLAGLAAMFAIAGCAEPVIGSVDSGADSGAMIGDAGSDGDAGRPIEDAGLDANLPDADLPDADLPDANLADADLPDADLPDANLPDANLLDAGVGEPDACVAAAETCNGLDDDCDGTVDNGVPAGAPCSAGIGACARPGTVLCVGGARTGCSAVAGVAASDVMCDGVDTDCDGIADPMEMTANETCPWRRCVSVGGGSSASCDLPAQVAVGAFHSCVRLNDSGDLWCWGDNRFTQLPGIPLPSPPAALAPTRSTLGDVSDMCASERGTCILRAGLVQCVGLTPPATGARSLWTRTVDATDIACGGNHMCLVTSAGTVQCAGTNGVGAVATGQIGRPVSDGVGPFSELNTVTLPAGRTARAVSVGGSFSCALLDDGRIACWGAEGGGQLGRGAATIIDGFMHLGNVVVEAPGVTFLGLASAASATCANAGSDTYCWGYQFEGVVLGQPTTGAYTNRPTTAPVGVGPFVLSGLVGGPFNMCARQTSGQMVCWGRQFAGEFGLMPRSPIVARYNLPQLALPRSGGTSITTTAMAMGYADGGKGRGGHACVIASGEVYCWGSNVAGQAGRLPVSARIEDAVVVTP